MRRLLPRCKDDSCVAGWRFRLIRASILLSILPLILLGISNLWLGSSWGMGMAEDKLKGLTGMDWRLHGMSWSPWGGVNIKGGEVLQPTGMREYVEQPLVEVNRVNIRPYWGRLLRGEMKLREVTVESPHVTISAQMLARMTAKPPPPEVVIVQPAILEPKLPKVSAPVENKPEPQSGEALSDKAPGERAVAGLPFRVIVRNANIEVISAVKEEGVFGVLGVDFDLPLSGDDAAGYVQLSELKILGEDSVCDFRQEVVWKRPFLKVEEWGFDIGGVLARGTAQLGVQRGFPFSINLIVDPQEVENFEMLGAVALDVKARQLNGEARFKGSLRNPLSWQSLMRVQSSGFTVVEKHGGHELYFDELSIPVTFQAGTLYWASARVMGEDVSLLANGRLSVYEGITSVTRIVAEPELSQKMLQAMVGAGLTEQGAWWDDLETPDRKYRDIHVMGPLMDPSIDIGRKHADLPLWQSLSSVLNFIRVEMKEEGVDLRPITSNNILNPSKR